MKERWDKTKYQGGDMVHYAGSVYEIYQINITRGTDRRPKPMYQLRHKYPKPNGKGFAYTLAYTAATRLKKVK